VARKHVVFEDRKLSKLKKKYVAGSTASTTEGSETKSE
jgi:hypothetical protein